LYCQMSILMNESLNMVDICACSHKERASRSWFLAHLRSPRATKILQHVIQNHY
jgi:hypothetical protein